MNLGRFKRRSFHAIIQLDICSLTVLLYNFTTEAQRFMKGLNSFILPLKLGGLFFGSEKFDGEKDHV